MASIPSPTIVLRSIRPHQWVKNALVFVPAFLAHRLEPTGLINLTTAFIAFSLCSSSAYLLNDILDREADRAHPSKRVRPVASGALSLSAAAVLSVLLLAAGLTIGATRLPPAFAAVLLIYSTLVGGYSLWLKYKQMIDVLCLAGFYSLRVFGGAVAAQVPLSPWFLAFSTFLFFGLALVKRFTEIKMCREIGQDRLKHRDYHIDDEFLIVSAGICSGYLSVLVFYLYITGSETVVSLYTAPQWLWLIGPLLLYWFTRLWFRAQRGKLDSDPVLFAVKDPASWITGLLAVACIVAAASLNHP